MGQWTVPEHFLDAEEPDYRDNFVKSNYIFQ